MIGMNLKKRNFEYKKMGAGDMKSKNRKTKLRCIAGGVPQGMVCTRMPHFLIN